MDQHRCFVFLSGTQNQRFRIIGGKWRPIKLLLIDDDPVLRDLIQRILELMSYIVVSSENGKEVLGKAAFEKPDLILLDIMMSEMDGWKTTQLLRMNPHTKNIPILATTGMSRASELKTCLEVGCNDYIVKPFSFVELQEKIRLLLADTSVRQASSV